METKIENPMLKAGDRKTTFFHQMVNVIYTKKIKIKKKRGQFSIDDGEFTLGEGLLVVVR